MEGMVDRVQRSDEIELAFEYSPRHLAALGSTGRDLLPGSKLSASPPEGAAGEPSPDARRRRSQSTPNTPDHRAFSVRFGSTSE